jgi:signal transduction histidine kinase
MMSSFLACNRKELVTRCIDKVAKRPKRNATTRQLQNGIPMFLEQLTRTLEAEQGGDRTDALKISGASGGNNSVLSEMGVSAAAHGKNLLELGYSVDQVVHDYGDLCQAITDLAFERDAPFSVDEFRTLNRCLDNAIADAVTEFSFQRDTVIAEQQSVDTTERLGFLMHELRNSLTSATLAVDAIELGSLGLTGATGAVLKRSLGGMGKLIDRSLSEVRIRGATQETHQMFSLAGFIAEAASAAHLDAHTRGCVFTVAEVDPLLGVVANRDLLLGALANLLHNAFKFTHSHTEVTLNAYPLRDRIIIDVGDNCGGLPPGNAENMFMPYSQHNHDRTGLGLGLSIAWQSVTEQGGLLTVQDMPGLGCTFTISLPRYTVI